MKYFWNKFELSYPFVVLIQLRDVEDLVRVADFSAHPFQLPIPRFKLTQFETLHAIQLSFRCNAIRQRMRLQIARECGKR